MKLKELKSILYSNVGDVIFASVYDYEKNVEIDRGASIEYIIENHGEKEVKRITADSDIVVITV
jgi:hypothetical protein